MKRLSFIKNILTGAIFFIVVVVGVLVFLSGKNDIQGWRILIVKSGSMEPTIKTGSLIIVHKQAEYQKGDVVTFGPVTRPELLVTHRIVDIIDKDNEKYIKTKGDFNAAEDLDLTPEKSIVAKYSLGIPYLGYLIGFAQTQLGVVLLIIIPGTILIYDEFTNLKKAVQELYQKMTKKDSSKPEKKEETV